jgi:diadenosine hexaphosphate hydrolase (ATP-forming)
VKKIVEGAGGVVFNKAGQVLVLGHRNGTWVFPKGHIDPGETHLVAAIREVEEESGVVSTCLDESITYKTRYRNARREERVITWFLLTSDAEDVSLREATFPKGGFYSREKAMQKLTFEEDKVLLEYMIRAAGQQRRSPSLSASVGSDPLT